MYLPDSATIYPGEYYAISAQSNCSIFIWTPSYGLSNSEISNPVATPEMDTKYYVAGQTEWGCIITDSISIFVNPESLSFAKCVYTG